MKNIIVLLLISSLALTACKKHKSKKKANWITKGYASLETNNYPQIKAVNWWNENWRNGFLNHTRLRLDSSPNSLKAYREAVKSPFFITDAVFANGKLIAPVNGMYHCGFPDFGGDEDNITTAAIKEFIDLAQKDIVWASFSNNWITEIKFPIDDVNTIVAEGKIPYIRIMPKTTFTEDKVDDLYTMQRIIDGEFDVAINKWFVDAKNSNTPLLVEFGTEVNGSWFPWNGKYHGGGEKTAYGDPTKADGPERFVDAYRHFVDICNANSADNITWFFHLDDNGEPYEDWNKFENYYPGDSYVDWMGVSVYGQITKKDDYGLLGDKLDEIYPRIVALTDKPIAILETGMIE